MMLRVGFISRPNSMGLHSILKCLRGIRMSSSGSQSAYHSTSLRNSVSDEEMISTLKKTVLQVQPIRAGT